MSDQLPVRWKLNDNVRITGGKWAGALGHICRWYWILDEFSKIKETRAEVNLDPQCIGKFDAPNISTVVVAFVNLRYP